MNRLDPLIRRPRALAIPLARAEAAAHSDLLEDLRFFATVWIGGLVFFGTLFA